MRAALAVLAGSAPLSSPDQAAAQQDRTVASELDASTIDPTGNAPGNHDAVYNRVLAERRATLNRLTPVTERDLAQPAPGDWLAWRRAYSSQGFSPLTSINKHNARRLTVAWSWGLPVSANEIAPLAHDGVLFIYSGNRIEALDGATGELLWRYMRPLPPALQNGAAAVVRSIAIYGDKLYVPTADGHLVALKASTGKVVWDKGLVTQGDGLRVTGGPLVVKGKVIQGVSLGFNYKGGCFIVALDAETGEETWRFKTIARPGQPGGDSWNGAPLEERFGASVWTAGSYDPATGLVYFGVGQTYNTSTLLQPQKTKGESADALYTDSTVALDPQTGKLAWYYQHLSRDVWDMDWAFERALVDVKVDGRPRRLSVTAGKIAMFDAIDRETGKYVFSKDLGLQNIVAAVDPVSGKKIINPAVEPKPGQKVFVCPHAGGARSWPASAYNPKTKIIYLPMVESCMDHTFTPQAPEKAGQGGLDMRWVLRPRPGSDGNFGQVAAVNLETRQVVWRQRRRAPQSSSALVTGGGLVFEGSRDRTFRALDDLTGRVLWETRLGAAPSSTPITYSVRGRQYVAVVAGGGGGHDVTWPSFTPEIEAGAPGVNLWVFTVGDRRSHGSASLKAH